MQAQLEVESTLTDRYQTTVPDTVRRALKLGKRDKIHYTIRPNGEVVISRAQADHNEDPILSSFLSFLANDISQHPERIKAIDTNLAKRITTLVKDIDVDLDAPLSADEE